MVAGVGGRGYCLPGHEGPLCQVCVWNTSSDEPRTYFDERRAAKQAARGERDAELASWRGAHAEAAEAWTSARERRVPADLPERLCAGVGEKEDATRNHGKRALQALVECVPHLLGGSADDFGLILGAFGVP